MISRRQFLVYSGGLSASLLLANRRAQAAPANPPVRRRFRQRYSPEVPHVVPGGTLDPNLIPKYQTPLLIPPVMPQTAWPNDDKADIDYYEIAMRQFKEQILPPGLPKTTVWGYGSVNHAGTFNAPSLTIEATYNRPVRVKWINDLKDPQTGRFQPHLLAVDQTLHWANPAGPRDMHGMEQAPYRGPVPIVTHVHGAHSTDESDGYPEAWFLPAATDIPAGYATKGTWYETFRVRAGERHGLSWEPGSATFQYRNDQRATTLWYHDHTLGMTRLNVYAGPAGFYLLRGGPDDLPAGVLPGPAPTAGDAPGTHYYEIPIAIQDRSFNADGSLFFPDTREFFDGFPGPYVPDSDISPIWNPEFFGNTMMVNGNTWPYLQVEPRRYRFRLLNGCNARTLVLKFNDPRITFWQIGSEGGFLPQPVNLQQLLIAPAERADVIVDFGALQPGSDVTLLNLGPDEPFQGGIPGQDTAFADPNTTGQVMQFRLVAAAGKDSSTPPDQLVLPHVAPIGAPTVTRQVSLNEEDSEVLPDTGPRGARLGSVVLGGPAPLGQPKSWNHPIAEHPDLGATEEWEIYNFTADAHPIHIHQVMFQVVNREVFDPVVGTPGAIRGPEPWETGFKDTVVSRPGEITRVRLNFDLEGLYVWHCHIIDHEDNEMMRPYGVGQLPILITPRMFLPYVKL